MSPSDIALIEVRKRLENYDKLRDRIRAIAGDFVPDNDGVAPLALSEMREALWAALEEVK